MSTELQDRAAVVKSHDVAENGRTEILAKVSHELRTPLTAAQESVAIVLEELAGPINARQLEFLTVAQRNIQRLKRLIEDLLDLSPNQQRQGPLVLAPTDLRSVALAAIAARRQLGEDPRCADLTAGPPLLVAADFESMRQVICRLLDNAAFYSSKDRVSLEIQRTGDEVRLVVCDDGPGIPSAEAERIFEPFVQLGRSEARAPGRAGLGLTLARQFVERQGGSLWAEQREEGGARFVISLKLLSD